MSPSDMWSSIDMLKAAEVQGLIFTGGGEPLTNENTPKAIKYAKEKGLSVGLFTNGYLLDSKITEYLLSGDHMPDFIRISINAGTRETYQVIHGCNPDGFDTVLNNLSFACKTKLEREAKTNIDIGVLVTPTLLNTLIDLAIEIKRIALKYPHALNSVLFRPAVRYRKGCRNNIFSEELMGHPDFGLEYKKFFQTGKQFGRNTFQTAMDIIDKRIRPLLMDNSDSTVRVLLPEVRFGRILEDHADRSSRRCLACNLVVFVAPDTSVYRCVEQALDPSLRLGWLNKVQAFKELWKQDVLKQTFPDPGNCPPVCLLYETDSVWQEIREQHDAGHHLEELTHRIDMAREYFGTNIAPRIGTSANFI